MLKFTEMDLKRLEELSTEHLYLLNRDLYIIVSNAKKSTTIAPFLMKDIVAIAETAAKEVACRNRWSPIVVANDISYYTQEFRQWLVNNRNLNLGKQKACEILDFSFWDELLSTIA